MNSMITIYYTYYLNSSSYSSIIIQIALLPLIYKITEFELVILNETCPLGVNIFLYLTLTLLISIISFGFAYLEYLIIYSKVMIIHNFESTIYCMMFWNNTFLLYILYLLLPDWMYNVVSWLNIRVLYWLFLPSMILLIIWNAIIKKRYCFHINNFAIIIVSEFIISTCSS